MKGIFISIEGSEGAGKSTVINWLKHKLNLKREVLFTREPGGTPLAEKIREVLLSPTDEVVHADAELLLLYAARVQHWREHIEPALKRGAVVLCDRFTDATIAYQGFGRGTELDRIRSLDQWAMAGIRPDMTFYLDVPVDLGLSRIANRRHGPDRFEQEAISFFERVRAGYLALAAESHGRIEVIDATQEIETVCNQVLARLLQVITDA